MGKLYYKDVIEHVLPFKHNFNKYNDTPFIHCLPSMYFNFGELCWIHFSL